MPRGKKLVSIIIPTFNEVDNIPVIFDAIKNELDGNFTFEVIFINDGSSDGSLTIIKKLAKSNKQVRFISFSRNFGHQAALRAGINNAYGECVISMDADMQHPPKLLKNLLSKWQEGYDIVYTRRKNVGDISIFKRASSRLFYNIVNKLSDLNIEYGAADFRLIDRKVANVIRELPSNELFMRGFIAWCGFKQCAIDYVPAKRFAGTSKYSFRKMYTLAMQGITQFSIKPLRIANVLGFLSAFSGLLYGIYVAWSHFFGHTTVSGWTSVMVCILIIGGIQLIILGIVGEYLGRTFLQTTALPNYIIDDELLDKTD